MLIALSVIAIKIKINNIGLGGSFKPALVSSQDQDELECRTEGGDGRSRACQSTAIAFIKCKKIRMMIFLILFTLFTQCSSIQKPCSARKQLMGIATLEINLRSQ